MPDNNRLLAFVISCALLVPSISSCTQAEQEILVQAVTINQPSAEMVIGETVQLSATITPSNATDKEITWSSTKQSVATVSTTGLVSAISEGESTITAAVGGKTASCTISVIKGFVAVESIELDENELTLVEGDDFSIKATVKPEDATEKNVLWSSSDSKVATVDDSGRIRAIQEGEAIIVANAGDKSAECKVTVTAKKIDVTMVLLNKTVLSMIVGDEQTLIATIVPDNATVQTVQWSTSDVRVAMVEDGKVTAIKEGSAKIVAYVDGKTAECDVTVSYIPVQSINFDKSVLTLYEGESYSLQAVIVPENATYQDITWSTTDTKVATVEDGLVETIKKGAATIKAEANGKSTLCQVEVLSSIAEISLDKSELDMIVGEAQTLTAIITPTDATLREKIIWATSDDKIATVDESGKVIAVKEGSATISAMVEGKTAECLVNIDYVHVSSIDISQEEATLYIGESISLTANLIPDNVTYNTMEWVSSNDNIVTVSESGRVNAVGKGTATVYVKSDGKDAKCDVTVLVPLAGLSFDQNSLTLFKGSTSTLSVIKTPVDATIKGDIIWSSSNTSVASVGSSGVVSAITKGSANITASVDGQTAYCTVTVLDAVAGIKLDQSSVTVNRGESLKLACQVIPEGATLQGDFAWVSSNPEVATVDNEGNVTARSAGSADITVSLEGFTATCHIAVVVPVNSVSLDKSALSLNKGENAQLVATVMPTDATDKTVTWTSSNPAVATVSNGKVTAVSKGSTTILAAAGGKEARCEVTVFVPLTGIEFDYSSLTIQRGDTRVLTVKPVPSDADLPSTIEWASSAPDVVVVENGKLNALKAGKAIVSATTGGFEASCSVEVEYHVNINLAVTEIHLKPGDKYKLSPTTYPAGEELRWVTNNGDVASVSTDGTVTATGIGTTTVCAYAVEANPAVMVECTVVVSIPIEGVSLNYTNVNLLVGESVQLIATILPTNHSEAGWMEWSSDNYSVATVNSSGKIVAKGEGETNVIVVLFVDGDNRHYVSKCHIVVKKTASGGHEGTGSENWD